MNTCTRCGDCCAGGGPALHAEDRPLVGTVLAFSDLVTLRAGEPAHDQPSGLVLPLGSEIVKVAGSDVARGKWSCRFYQVSGVGETKGGCSIYENRPLECRLLDCRDTSALEGVYGAGRLARLDLLPMDSVPATLLREHEAACPAGRAVELARTPGKEAAGALAEILAYDRAFRAALCERGMGEGELLFLLGRPLEIMVEAVRRAGAFEGRGGAAKD